MNLKKLKDFLRRNIQDVDRPEGPVTKVVLAHIRGKVSKGNEVFSKRIPYDEYKDEDTKDVSFVCRVDEVEIEELARELYVTAENDAVSLGGTQPYKVMVFCKYETNCVQRLPFRIMGEETEESASVDEGNVGNRTMLAQSWRHIEALMRMTTMSMGALHNTQNRLISRLSDQNDRLLSKHQEMIQTSEELHSRKHEREVEVESMRMSEHRNDALWRKLLTLAPIALNKLAGSEIIPAESSVEVELMRSIVSEMTEEQLEKFSRTLTPNQQAAFATLVDRTLEREEEIEEAKKGVLAGLPPARGNGGVH